MRYEVVTPVYNGPRGLAVEDYVFVEANTPADAAALAVPMLKDQYPDGYYATIEPDNELEGLRFNPTQAGSDYAGSANRNITPASPDDKE